MKWSILIILLLIPSLCAGAYTIGNQMQPTSGLDVNSNGYSFKFSSGYIFTGAYTGNLGILNNTNFIQAIINTTIMQQQGSGGGVDNRILINKVNDCGLTVYAEKLTPTNKKISYVVLDANNNPVKSEISGSKLYDYTNTTITSKFPLIFSDNIYVKAETGSCTTYMKVPVEKKYIYFSWAILIAVFSTIILFIVKRKK